MGDLPPGSPSQAEDNAATVHDDNTVTSTAVIPKSPTTNTPFHSQLSGLPQQQQQQQQQQQRVYGRPFTQQGAQYQYPGHSVSPINVGATAGALQDYRITDDSSLSTLNTSTPSVSCGLSGALPSAVAYHSRQNLQMHSHVHGTVSRHSGHATGYIPSPYQQNVMFSSQDSPYTNHPSFGANPPLPGVPLSMPNPYHNYYSPSQYVYYSDPYRPHNQFSPGFASQGADTQSLYGRAAPGFANNTEGVRESQVGILMNHTYNDGIFSGLRMGPVNLQGGRTPVSQPYGAYHIEALGTRRMDIVGTIPRGPPRKPKQSGHALWVGNLPPGTTVVSLKDHFSRDATKDIESLFLISKSNCAFVNYNTEDSCTAAMHRFHDSRFNGVRLVCRLRRSSAPASGVPTGPSAMLGTQQQLPSRPATPRQDSVTPGINDPGTSSPTKESDEDRRASADTANKYFVVKSLTLQDLELSVRNGIWATQSHNEDALNRAYETAENVYLIFSANKSGEYFGFARMASPIIEDNSRSAESFSRSESSLAAFDVPKSIPTPATEWAPRGKIIDDSARGTIFWEAEVVEPGQEEGILEGDKVSRTEGESVAATQGWGKHFKVEWVSTNRLPFYLTRGLRNPWNANREVKIARDGTELEPSVGKRLLQMFHRMSGAPVTRVASEPAMDRSRPAQVSVAR